MVGREVNLTVRQGGPTSRATTVLEIRDLVVRDDRGLAVVNGVSLDVRAGEIVALAGVQGNGQTELVEAIAGLRPSSRAPSPCAGATSPTPRRARSSTPDSATSPRTASATVWCSRCPSRTTSCSTRPGARPSPGAAPATSTRCARNAERAGQATSTSAPTSIDATGRARSRAATSRRSSSRASSRAPSRCFVASQPTRGLDVGSIEYVHRQIVRRAQRGHGGPHRLVRARRGLALGDRIAVMHRGQITGVVDAVDQSRGHRPADDRARHMEEVACPSAHRASARHAASERLARRARSRSPSWRLVLGLVIGAVIIIITTSARCSTRGATSSTTWRSLGPRDQDHLRQRGGRLPRDVHRIDHRPHAALALDHARATGGPPR